jgi:hypothetical protein
VNTFYEVFGVVAALCAGIIILGVFFTGLGYFRRTVGGSTVLRLKGFVREGKLINVDFGAGKSLHDVRFIGFTQGGGKGGVPFALVGMLIFETTNGSRILVPSKSVRMIEEVGDVS